MSRVGLGTHPCGDGNRARFIRGRISCSRSAEAAGGAGQVVTDGNAHFHADISQFELVSFLDHMFHCFVEYHSIRPK